MLLRLFRAVLTGWRIVYRTFFWVSIFIHELGHYIGYMSYGYKPTYYLVGVAIPTKELFKLPPGTYFVAPWDSKFQYAGSIAKEGFIPHKVKLLSAICASIGSVLVFVGVWWLLSLLLSPFISFWIALFFMEGHIPACYLDYHQITYG